MLFRSGLYDYLADEVVNVSDFPIFEWFLSQLIPEFVLKTFILFEQFSTSFHDLVAITLFDYCILELLEVRNGKHEDAGRI